MRKADRGEKSGMVPWPRLLLAAGCRLPVGVASEAVPQ